MVLKKYVSLLLLPFLSSGLLGAINSSYKISAKQVLRVNNGAEPKELDPATSTGIPESHIIDNLFEGLTSLDSYTLDPVPGVAESWTISPDGKVYTFKLRPDAAWSDGKKITSHDFQWSWLRVLEPKTAAEYAYQLYYVKNAEAYNLGKIKDAKQVGIETPDDRTLKVTLENSTPYFLRLTAFHTLYPVPKHVIDKYPGQEWTKEGKIVSNGPFALAEWKLNQHIKLVPNSHYWKKSSIKLKEAFLYGIENENTSEKTFTAGELDMTDSVPSVKIDTYNKEKKNNPNTYHPFKSNPYLGTYLYTFNVTRKPLNDVRVRKALALTVDRKLIVEKVLKGGQLPAMVLTPPNTAGYTHANTTGLKESVTEATIKEAKKLLADAGYPDGKNMPPVEILYNTNEDHKKIAVALQQMWKKNLGIEATLFNQEWKVYLDTKRNLNYSLARFGWIGDYPDPNTFLDLFTTHSGNNQTGWSNKEYDKLIDMAAKTSDSKKRYEYFHNAEDILLTELPILPIYFYTKQNLLSPKVKMFKEDGTITEWQSNITNRWAFKSYVLVD